MSKLAKILAVLSLLGGSTASAQQKVVVAIYAPNAPFDSGAARYSFISLLAQQIQSVAGVPAEPKAFARAADFEAALKTNSIDFAVVDGIYLAEKGNSYTILAVATAGGKTSVPWSLFTKDVQKMMDLQGKKLAFAATGPKDSQLIDNAFLDGELAKHFGARQNAPDIASAVQAVSLHKADCVFTPDSLGKNLHKVFEAGSIPNPAFLQIKSTLSPEIVSKVKSAVQGHTAAGGAYDGWKAGTFSSVYGPLAGRLGGKARKPVMAEPEVVRLDETDVVVPPPLEWTQPNIKEQFWNPSGAP